MIVVEYAKTFLGKPYLYGGDDPLIGFDCSGLVIECLKSVGMFPLQDMTAQNLYSYFKPTGTLNKAGPGALCFYGKSTSQISHIAIMINDFQVLEAGGGTSQTDSFDDAVKQNAFIRIRPFMQRKDFVEVIMPSYPEWVRKAQ